MLFFNEDWMHFLWTRYKAGIDVDEKVLREFIYQYKDTQITDFCMNVNGTISTAKSDILETYADKYIAKEENGIPVNFKNTYAQVAYQLICEKNIDMYAVWIKALKEIGINPWLSFRTNDCHDNCQQTGMRKSSFVDSRNDHYIASHRQLIGYFDKCFDYTSEHIMSRMTGYIDEMLSRYDVYGIELDFMRDLYFTRPGFEIPSGVVKELVTSICEIKAEYETKYGHKIKLALILPSNPNFCIERGVNILDFLNEIDYITIIPRWETIDTDMPIEVWKQILRNTDIKLGGGQQCLFKPHRGYLSKKEVSATVGMALGQSVSNLSRGCDYVYLYNHMDNPAANHEVPQNIYDTPISNSYGLSLILTNSGELNTLMKHKRSHVVTYADFCKYDNSVSTKLPIKFPANEFEIIKIPVGRIHKDSDVKLILGITSEKQIEAENLTAYVNSAHCSFCEKVDKNSAAFTGTCYVFNITENLFDILYAEIKIEAECLLEYVEVCVNPQQTTD